VVVFFDEMDALFRPAHRHLLGRGTTIVPQLLAEIDGVEGCARIVIGPQPPGPHRSGHPAAGTPRREDQDRAAGSRRAGDISGST